MWQYHLEAVLQKHSYLLASEHVAFSATTYFLHLHDSYDSWCNLIKWLWEKAPYGTFYTIMALGCKYLGKWKCKLVCNLHTNNLTTTYNLVSRSVHSGKLGKKNVKFQKVMWPQATPRQVGIKRQVAWSIWNTIPLLINSLLYKR